MLQAISEKISEITGQVFNIETYHSVSGGCINQAYCIDSGQQKFFVKTNQANQVAMFQAEFLGLQEIIKSATIQAPAPVCYGQTGQHSYLVLQWVEFSKNSCNAQAGQQLAAMHQCHATQFGWLMDNTIGSTLQQNTKTTDWVKFYTEQRLFFQLELAANNGFSRPALKQAEKLLLEIEAFYTTYTVQPSLLHGDLWSGNIGCDAQGHAILFDPAVYYGDRETDIAMTELFAGFGPEFYRSYNEYYALDEGYSVRKSLYNLYHILNHYNLFGGSYANQAVRMIQHLISEVR